MNINCGVCGSEKRNDEYHEMYRRCDLCNTKHALKYYYFAKDKKLEKEKITIILIKKFLVYKLKNEK